MCDGKPSLVRGSYPGARLQANVARGRTAWTNGIRLSGLMLLGAGLIAAVASAQVPVKPAATTNVVVERGGGGGFGGFGGGLPYGYGMGGFGMPGTAASSAEFGMASVISAAGYANLQNSEAAKNYEQARSMDYSNRQQWTEAYFQMRQAHRDFIAVKDRMSTDEINKIARDAAPKRLDASQLDPITGQINWPVILRDQRYAASCGDIENLYRMRASTSGFIGSEAYLKIGQACDKLMEELKANLNEYDPKSFQVARHFIDSLRYEVQVPSS